MATVLLVGATGTIGRATAAALVGRGHRVLAIVRARSEPGGRVDAGAVPAALPGCDVRLGDVGDRVSLDAAIGAVRVDALVSCLASRTGVAADAWAVDHRANATALAAARGAGATRAVLLSAMCVQKPMLAFQHAKLAFEAELMASGLAWSIVRPSAYMKSLSGQFTRVKAGKPYLLFGDGALTATKPVGDADLGGYLADQVDDPAGRVLPIGGPGPALTPRAQGEAMFAALGLAPRFRQVPIGLMDAVVGVLGAGGRLAPRLAAKAELARIGRYYATQSMLVWDADAGRYDADATPSTGTYTLPEHFARLARGEVGDERGEHAVF